MMYTWKMLIYLYPFFHHHFTYLCDCSLQQHNEVFNDPNCIDVDDDDDDDDDDVCFYIALVSVLEQTHCAGI